MNHGHVKPNPDGSKARCGGPAICSECAQELASLKPDGNVHTMQKAVPHIESEFCWCQPILQDDFTDQGGKKHFVHRGIQ